MSVTTATEAKVYQAPGEAGSPDGPGHQGRPGVDQLLPPVPAGAAFGGYKMSGVGRETLTEHYSQTKSLLVSYSDQALGLF